MTAHLTREEVLERLEGDDCELSLEEDSDFNEDGIYGYMAEVNNTLSLAALCSEGCWILGKKMAYAASLVQPVGTTVPVFGMETVDYWQSVVVLIMQNYICFL